MQRNFCNYLPFTFFNSLPIIAVSMRMIEEVLGDKRC
jgi:hypothetical protein